jgi:NAD(P)H-hydrate repair Nnr-like enzyme with NAD(P)H-hydrate epimerase domain
MNRAHEVERLEFSGTVMCLRVDGRDYRIDIVTQSERLARATPAQRAHFEVSPAGYGIHWPEVDEDLSIDSLIGVTHRCPLTEAAA